MKKAWSISSMYRLEVFIEFCYLNVWLKTKQTLKALLTLNAMVPVTASYLQPQQLKSRKYLESNHQNRSDLIMIRQVKKMK